MVTRVTDEWHALLREKLGATGVLPRRGLASSLIVGPHPGTASDHFSTPPMLLSLSASSCRAVPSDARFLIDQCRHLPSAGRERDMTGVLRAYSVHREVRKSYELAFIVQQLEGCLP